MQRKTLTLAALTVVAGVLLAASSLRAAALSYTAGDLLIGFTATGSNTTYLINIGQASTYRNATQPITLNLNIGADLVSEFSSVDEPWHQRDGLRWGVFGATSDNAVAGDDPFTLYAGRTTSAGYLRGSTFTQRNPAYYIQDVAASYVALGNSTSGTTVGAFQDNDAVNSFAKAQNEAGTISFQYFSNALASFDNGASTADLNLFRMTTGSGTGQLLGTFSISEAGVITFTPVPEPSVVILMAVGLIGLFVIRRRRAARA